MQAATKLKSSDPRKRKTGTQLRQPKVKMTKATDAALLIDNIRGEQYSNKEQQEVRAAEQEAERIVEEFTSGVSANEPCFQSPFAQRANGEEKNQWRDMRNAVIAYVDDGIGPVFMMERGDIGVCQYVLKHRNKHGKPGFTYTIGAKKIVEWESSKKYWVYNYECTKRNYAKLVSKMKGHSELEGWAISDMGVISMGRVATTRAIYGHLMRQQSPGNVNLAEAPPPCFFRGERNVKCLKSWVDCMTTKLNEAEGAEEW